MKRKELCDRIFRQSINSLHGDNLTTASLEEPPVLRYSEYRAVPSAGAPDFVDENARSGFEEGEELEASYPLNYLIFLTFPFITNIHTHS